MPLKLAGILMKYMQLQRARMSSCQLRTDKTAGVFCRSGSFKGDLLVLQPPPRSCPSALALLLGHAKRGRASHRGTRGKQLSSVFCAKSLLEQSVRVHVRDRQGSARAGSMQLFIGQTAVQDFENLTCFSALCRCTVCSKALKASRNLVKTQRV